MNAIRSMTKNVAGVNIKFSPFWEEGELWCIYEAPDVTGPLPFPKDLMVKMAKSTLTTADREWLEHIADRYMTDKGRHLLGRHLSGRGNVEW